MSDAYLVKSDVSIPQPLGTEDGTSTGRNYAVGDYVFASEMTERDRERADNGDLDLYLEPAKLEDAQLSRQGVQYGVFIAEHEVEAFALNQQGHEVVPREQVLDLKSAGAEGAKVALLAARESRADERPNLVAREVSGPNHETAALAVGADEVEVPAGVEQPPGHAIGDDLAAAAGTPVDAKPKRARRRPGSAPGNNEAGDKE